MRCYECEQTTGGRCPRHASEHWILGPTVRRDTAPTFAGPAFPCQSCESLRREVAALRAVVEALPRCMASGCSQKATHMTCGLTCLCDRCAEEWRGGVPLGLPYRKPLLALLALQDKESSNG